VAKTQEFLNGLDANKNGMIEADEASGTGAKMMLDRIFGQMGKQPHYPMAISEITQGYEASLRAGGSPSSSASASAGKPAVLGDPGPPGAGRPGPTPSPGFGGGPPSGPKAAFQSPGSASATSTSEAKQASPRPIRFKRGVERLSKDLPGWYLSLDVDGEGQITMAQYLGNNWTQDKVDEFNHYDLNRDGIITADEVLKVENGKAGPRR